MSDPSAALRAVGGDPSAETTNFPNIPSVPVSDSPGVTNFLTSVKNWLEKAGGSGLSGLATRRDLASYGVIEVEAGGGFGPVRAPNKAVPPTPTGVIASGAFTNIILEWDDPNKAYGNHAFTEVWASETDNFTNASLVGESSGFSFAHAVGEDSIRYYWIRFVSTSDVRGPYNSVNGVLGQTSVPVEFLMDTLSDEYGDVPFFDILTPQVINGVSIPAGRYMKAAYIMDASITNAKIKNATIDSAKIADASIVRAKIGNAAIGSAQIEDASIYTAKIADAAITDAKIYNLTANKITAGTMSADRIDSNSLYTKLFYAGDAYIGNLAVNTIKIANNAITVSSAGSWGIGALNYVGGARLWISFAQVPQTVTLIVEIGIETIDYGSLQLKIYQNGSLVTTRATASGSTGSAISTTVVVNCFPGTGATYYDFVATLDGLPLNTTHASGAVTAVALGALR